MQEKERFLRSLGEDLMLAVRCCVGVVGFSRLGKLSFFWSHSTDVVSKLYSENFFLCRGENRNGETEAKFSF